MSYWYHLSDVRTEELLKVSLICMSFCDLRLEGHIPDHTPLCKFCNEIVAKNTYESLLKKINKLFRKASGYR
ncbi:MAG: transposase [Flavobacteriales bacterium Tduv]